MAFRVSATMAFCILVSLVAVAHCVPLEADRAASAAVTTVPDGEEEGLLRFPSRDDDRIVPDAVVRDGEVPGEEEVVQPVAEPDPDRSHPEQDDEKMKEQIDDDEDEDDEEEQKARKNHGGDKEKEKKKRKKHHDCDGKEKKEKKMKKKHRSSDEEEEEEKTTKKIHRHRHVVKTKAKELTTHHNKNNGDDEDEQEKKEKRWRKAISRSMFGHGRRSQREEAAKDEVNN